MFYYFYLISFRELAKKIDRAVNNKTDFFENRRKPDIQTTMLVDSLNSFNKIEKVILNSYPLQLIYLDESITEEQKKEFLNRFHFKYIPLEERFLVSNKFNTVRNLL